MSRLATAARSLVLSLMVSALPAAVFAFPPGFYCSDDDCNKVFKEIEKADVQLDCKFTDDINFKRGPVDHGKSYTREQVADLLKTENQKEFLVASLSKVFSGGLATKEQPLDDFKKFLTNLGYKRTLILGYSPFGMYVLADRPDPVIDPRSLEAAFRASEWIALCSYYGYEHTGPIALANPPVAEFRFIELLKGPHLGINPKVQFEFEQPDTEEKRNNWRFHVRMMPQYGSKWILFVPNAVPLRGKGFCTYHGSYGRIEATKENREALNKIFEQHHGRLP